MATVKSLSQMMKPGIVLGNGDCESCGDSGQAKVVTRVAVQNLDKINKTVKKAAAAVMAANDEENKNVGNPNLPQLKDPPAPPEKRALLSPNKKEG